MKSRILKVCTPLCYENFFIVGVYYYKLKIKDIYYNNHYFNGEILLLR